MRGGRKSERLREREIEKERIRVEGGGGSHIVHIFYIKKYSYQTSNFVFSILKECYKNMLPKIFFCIISTQKTFSTLFISQFSHGFENQSYNALTKPYGHSNFVIIVTQPETNTGVTFFFCFFPIFVNIFIVFILLLN